MRNILFTLVVFQFFLISGYSIEPTEIKDKTSISWQDFQKNRAENVRMLANTIYYDVKRTDTNHPVFDGCIDWHSSVHGHWALLRSHRIVPNEQHLKFVKTSMNKDGMHSEYLFLKKHRYFEMPYGRAWFLLLISEYETVTQDSSYRYFGDYVAKSLEIFLQERAFDPATPEYSNHSWAYRQLIEYFRFRQDSVSVHKITGSLISNTQQIPETVNLNRDVSAPEFFSLWGNYIHLMCGSSSNITFCEELNENPPTDTDLVPVNDLYSAHHLSINYSRAWGFWTAYNATKDDRFLTAYIDHVKAGLSIHDQYVDSYMQYGHWVPQFGIYALTVEDF